MPARLSCVLVRANPSGSIRCSEVRVAAHNRATLPVLGGISGSTKTICIARSISHAVVQGPGIRRFHSGSPRLLRGTCSRVKHFPQYQSASWGSHAGHTPVFARKHPSDVLDWEFVE